MLKFYIGTDKMIKYDPEKSVLKYEIRDEIEVKESDFKLFCSEFYDISERK
jgi:hypothetical protein